MYKSGSLCPVCGIGTLQSKIITETLEYKGQKISVDDYALLECGECAESIIEPETLKRTEKILRDFKHKIDGLLTSNEIRDIRLKLGLKQEEFASRLHISRISLSRYENGKETQSKTVDALIRLIDKYTSPLKFDMTIQALAGSMINTGYKQKGNKYEGTRDDYEQAA